MQFLAAALIWGGYTMVYWGYCHVTGPRNGQDLTYSDLISPKKLGNVHKFFSSPKPSSTAAAIAGAQAASSTNPNPGTASPLPNSILLPVVTQNGQPVGSLPQVN